MGTVTSAAMPSCKVSRPAVRSRRCSKSSHPRSRDALFPAFAADADARRRRAVRYEERAGKRLARLRAIGLEIGDAFAGQKRVVDQEMAGEALRGPFPDRDRKSTR